VYPSHRPLSPAPFACSALCSPPAISQSVHTHDADNENDAMTLGIEATEGSFLTDGRLPLFA
jgi:hypothetical protein